MRRWKNIPRSEGREVEVKRVDNPRFRDSRVCLTPDNTHRRSRNHCIFSMKCIAYLYENLLHSGDRCGVDLVHCPGAINLKYWVYERRDRAKDFGRTPATLLCFL